MLCASHFLQAMKAFGRFPFNPSETASHPASKVLSVILLVFHFIQATEFATLPRALEGMP